MFSFVVFDPAGGPARSFELRGAHLFGPDDMPLQGQISFQDGTVRCTKASPDAAGLAIQYEVPSSTGAGVNVVTLRTCLLPSRQEPYLLSLELARLRIMLFLNKLEEWALFDLPSDHPVIQRFEQARLRFTAALVAQRSADDSQNFGGYSAEADRQARSALTLAYEAGEELTLLNAGRQVVDRATGKTYADSSRHYAVATGEKPPVGAPVLVPGAGHTTLPGSALVGCAINPGVFAEPLQKAVIGSCDFVTMPMRWIDMEPGEGQYSFAGTDKWIEWAVRTAKLPVHAGPLVDFRPTCTPEWLYIWENDYETLRELVVEHMQNVVTRYRRTVTRWTVCSGLHVNQHFKLKFEQIMDLTRICVAVVRKLHPAGKVQVEIAQPFGEYHSGNPKTLPPLLYAEALNQAGIPIDSYGLRLQLGQFEAGQSCRDMMTLSALLDRYGVFEKPIAITACGVPSATLEPRVVKERPESSLDEETPAPVIPDDPMRLAPGHWSEGFSDQAQAAWLTKFYAIAMGKPFVQSVCWQDLMDYPPATAPEMAHGGLVNAQGVLKPAGKRLAEVRQLVKEHKSPLSLLGS